jgi:hypothetical protein
MELKETTTPKFDRVLKVDVEGIASTEDKFILENGLYYNEAETIVCLSTNETGKYFKKMSDRSN